MLCSYVATFRFSDQIQNDRDHFGIFSSVPYSMSTEKSSNNMFASQVI